MTSEKATAIKGEIKRLQLEVAELRKARRAILLGASSVSISAGGGSKSLSNWDPEKIDAAIAEDLAQIKAYKRVLRGLAALSIGIAEVRRSV